MSAFTFAPAVRRRVKLKCLVTGPSGSGKTLGALSLATAMAPGKVALIDSEHDRSEYYADAFAFDKLALPDHNVKTYIGALRAAASAGYEVVVIDSGTHAWEDVLDRKAQEEKANPRSNSYTLWNKYGEQWNEFVREVLESPAHVIMTARSKQAYEQVEQNGKKKVEKMGMAPILRDGTEYEFALVFDLLPSHQARVSKDNTNTYDSEAFYDLTDAGLAQRLVAWLNGGAEAAPVLPRAEKSDKWSQPRPDPSKAEEPLTAVTAGDVIVPGKPDAWGNNGGKALRDVKTSVLRAIAKWVNDDEERAAKFTRLGAAALLLIAYREAEAKAAEAAAAVGAETEDVVAKLTAAVEADDASLPF